MALEPHPSRLGHPQERRAADPAAAADPAEESKTRAGPPRRHGRAGQPDAGPLGADIASFRLHLAAEGKAARTVQGYTGAVRWFATGYLLRQAGKTSWEQVSGQDIKQWMAQLLDRYSSAYASIQFRALRQFFKWLAAEEELPDPMNRLRAPKVAVPDVPMFTSVELSALEKACRGSTFAARRDAAIIAVFAATGLRLSELAGIRYDPGDPARSDLDLQAREIRIAGKAGKPRTVKIGHQAARSLDRYLRARARHPQAHRPQLRLGVNSRGPLTPAGIYARSSGTIDAGDGTHGVMRAACGGLLGRDAERFGMGPAVVSGQDLTEAAGPVRHGALADLATGDRQLGNGHREAAGR